MSKKAELLALAERVEAGSGRDFRLENEILRAVDVLDLAAGLSESIDDVERLRQKLLPGSQISVDVADDGVRAEFYEPINASGEAKTEARARLAALLRAYAEGVE